MASGDSEADSIVEIVPSEFILVVVIGGGEVWGVVSSSWRSEAMSKRVLWVGASRDGWCKGTSFLVLGLARA